MDPLETGIAQEFTELSAKLVAFQQWAEGLARLKKLLDEQTIDLKQMAAKLDEREKQMGSKLDERQAQLNAAADLLQERETKVKGREDAAKDLSRMLGEERAKIKGYQEREKHLEAKIETLRTEKGAANSQIAILQKKIKELEAAAIVQEPTPAPATA